MAIALQSEPTVRGVRPMHQSPPAASTGPVIRAAKYVRMSTEHQQYSTENQSDCICTYAEKHGMVIVKEYSDAGKSGLNLSGREGLQRLLNDVQSGSADFTAVLVYDVSRWGRFQDADESAYYEYICKRANVRVHYCAEQFDNDDGLPSSLLKTLKRTMAGEYSRELSVKVFAGQCRLIELGFRQGGPAGFGLRRQLVDRDRNPKELLSRGQHKSIQTDRVILVPGPDSEVETVREMYRLFTRERLVERDIAALLNARGIMTDLGRPWTRATVHQVITNPKYRGINIYNRHSFKLKRKHVTNPPEMWIYRPDAFSPIISAEEFEQASAIVAARSVHLSDEQMLSRLKYLFERHGTISGILIDETEDMPSTTAYRTRFGSLLRAYQLIGYTPLRDFRYIEINRALRQLHKERFSEITSELQKAGARVRQNENQTVEINNEFTASLVLARCRTTATLSHRWLIRLEKSLNPDVTIAARLQPDNRSILDYYLLPGLDFISKKLRLSHDNGVVLDVYRFENLNFLFSMARRSSVSEAA